MILFLFQRLAVTVGLTVTTLASCATPNAVSDGIFLGSGPALAMVPANHTNRYTVGIYVDKYWAGGVYPQSGGTAATCCFPGMKDWSKPVTVTWVWGAEEDSKTKTITMPREKHSVEANFPVEGPHRDRDWHKSDAYLCVILRGLNAAELAFSPTRSGCMSK
ncbi:DUF3304 domain-containing protein [Burkholderia gladioli]|uniref:DUF3304 domain-containing protein n=2 Tax=Burkholderia gladioli TaxID=28095 RepID=UPI0015E7405E|nr:DUF3304 domain-containing protein [Burkholderia gladioli]MBA1365888.1 DUF3304 domain-containing protein [Burkholderia gladioli]